ncbi:MAG: cyclic pyranopterin monophosphate synthase MoaC [Acidobacteria bacterium]|nr:MAG: cyclic pyranopterin monophosphate synthase MoaC [Acidobacteriota bacterium]REK02496.1 MAG: cyclic pyranopterin monophosphate synthase MoaC [Acidobacteriota bacterium]REK13702.1 MAG: cyclic pyranopterin monophosphate synthase MoaC [Acidobacteriota bacterium]REK41696.1 MAG: cyclic pyranopterin monophosphate synthase MoaC [Acidobacteriota bacterium]
MSDLSHFGKDGKVQMVDVSDKEVSKRTARATAFVSLSPETVAAIRAKDNPKGDPLEIARIAGITGGKKTSELIPLCHQLSLSNLDVRAEIEDAGVRLVSIAVTTDRTGVEMEALTAVSIAALTVYDMCKAVQKDIEITGIRLLEKTGGKEDYRYP